MEHKLASDKNVIQLLTILTQVLYYQIDIRFLKELLLYDNIYILTFNQKKVFVCLDCLSMEGRCLLTEYVRTMADFSNFKCH